jgi:hypothetical protein
MRVNGVMTGAPRGRPRGIESGMKQSEEIYRVDVVPIDESQADGAQPRLGRDADSRQP